MPSAVEVGFMFRGSDTDRNEGSLLGASLAEVSAEGPSRGVPGFDDSSETIDPGVPKSLTSVASSGVAGMESGVSMIDIREKLVRCNRSVVAKKPGQGSAGSENMHRRLGGQEWPSRNRKKRGVVRRVLVGGDRDKVLFDLSNVMRARGSCESAS